MYLRPALRNRQVCRELVQYILHVLHGRHHVHFFPEITTLVRLAREERWRSRGRSRFFNGCVAYETAGLEREPPIGPLLRGILLHRIQRRRPWLPTFGSRRSASLAIRRIQQHFRGTAVAERASAQ